MRIHLTSFLYDGTVLSILIIIIEYALISGLEGKYEKQLIWDTIAEC